MADSKQVVNENLTIERVDGEEGVLLKLKGELDLATAEHLDGQLAGAIRDADGSVVVDLSELKFVDSSGLRVLVNAERESRRDSRVLSFIRGNGQVARVMELTGLAGELTFVD